MFRTTTLAACIVMLTAIAAYSQSYVLPENRPVSKRTAWTTDAVAIATSQGATIAYTVCSFHDAGMRVSITAPLVESNDAPSVLALELGPHFTLSGKDLDGFFLYTGLGLFALRYGSSSSRQIVGLTVSGGRRWVLGSFFIGLEAGLRFGLVDEETVWTPTFLFPDGKIAPVLKTHVGFAL